MPNLTADSANPKVTFVDSGGPTDWWRLYGQSANDQVVITYGNAYGATALYKILAFYEP